MPLYLLLLLLIFVPVFSGSPSVIARQPVSAAATVNQETRRSVDSAVKNELPPPVVVHPDTVDTKNLVILDRMVVTATRTRRRVSETAASVTVVPRIEIERSPAKDINDLIANKTSVQVRRSVGMGEGIPSDISMRGIPGALAAARTLILVDGIPTNASGTPFLILNEIPVEIIDDVEIVRGPHSSLYGANAFGGVINVITTTGNGMPLIGGIFETSYPFNVLATLLDDNHRNATKKTIEQQALWNGDVLSSGGNGAMHYLVNGGYRSIGNYLMNDSALVRKSDTSYHIPATNYDYADIRLFGKFGYKVNERMNIEVHTRYFKSDLGYGITRYSPDTVDIDIEGEKIIVGPQIRYAVSDAIDIYAGGYLRLVNGLYMNEMNKKVIKWQSRSNDWQADLQTIIRPSGGHVITIGSELLSNAITFGDVIDQMTDSLVTGGVTGKIINFGIYIQDEMVLKNRCRIVPGFRMDYHTVFGTALSPKLGMVAPLGDRWRVRYSVGRAFRAPNHAELSMPPIPLKDTITLVSNPALKPEYIWAFDGGIDFMPLSGCKLQCGGFYNDMHDLIGQGIMLDRTTMDIYVTHKNISSAWSAGGELEGEWSILPELAVQIGYVYQLSKNVNASRTAAYFRKNGLGRIQDTRIELDYIPHHKADFNVVYTKNISNIRLSFSLDEMIVGTRHYLNFLQVDPGRGDLNVDPVRFTVDAAPPYQKLPVYSRTDILVRCDAGRLFGMVAVQNCFNAHYEENFGTLAPGRMATVKVGARW